MRRSFVLLGILTLIVPVLFLGCSGDDGSPGTSVGTVSGTVTNSATSAGLAGATVTLAPGGMTATTDANGAYSLSGVSVGVYSVAFTRSDFASVTNSNVSVLAGKTSTQNATLVPTVPVLVDIAVPGTPAPGATLAATVTATPLDGSTVTGVQWSQSNSVTVTIDNATATTTNVTLPDLTAYKDELFRVLAEPPITPAQLPPNVEAPASFAEQVQDRFGVQAVNPFALEEAGLVTLVATVTTTSGVYDKEFALHAELPWKQSTGIRNVPANVPVLLHGGTQGGLQSTWNWTVTGPAAAVLDNATAQNPIFTPTAAGEYLVNETVSGASFSVFAAEWMGAVTGLDSGGRPVAGNCSAACHTSIPAVTAIIGEWAQSGHAEIFTANINAGGHYGESCFPCHTVGYDTEAAAANNGIDDQTDFAAMIAKYFDDTPGFSLHGSPLANDNNYNDVLASFGDTAQFTNIQCENCHGPNGASGAHMQGIDQRVSLSSDVCGSCHGEPARHGRFQQWQVSPHSNYELAIEEGTNTNCGRCHSANGFIAWGKESGFDAGSNVTVTWDTTTVHSQTCAACHDPHDVGTVSGDANNAKVRVQNDTPILTAGFQVLDAGRGAICMVCHNTRRGLVNDNSPSDVITSGRAPHGGASADVLMGQNAFFVATGVRGKHSLIKDTCSNCHMQKTPPPAVLSYQLGGTNHTFLASRSICSQCHNSITADEVQNATVTQMNFLKAALESKLQALMISYAATDNLTLTSVSDPADETVTLPDVTIVAGDNVSVSNFADSHGRQAVDVTVNGVAGHVQLQNILVNTASNVITFNANAGNGPGESLAKAGWNYLMATNERSKGIHNPTFSLQIIAGAQQAVDGVAVP